MLVEPINKSRPKHFTEFVGQEHIKNVLQTAIQSSITSNQALWHILLSWKSGFGKTTLAIITATSTKSNIKIITWYAIHKPSELISLLNLLQEWDILFIDEIHRLKAPVEEVLYTAMEDNTIDMILPDGHHIKLPIEPFTLIWATTKLESLSEPLKNRFVYQFHMEPYTFEEKKLIIQRYLTLQNIIFSEDIVTVIADHIANVPRQIANFCHQLKDYLVVHSKDLEITHKKWDAFWDRTSLEKWWITLLHKRYLSILEEANYSPVGLKTLSVKLWMSEKSIENDIEPLLFELNRIEKTNRWRVIKEL